MYFNYEVCRLFSIASLLLYVTILNGQTTVSVSEFSKPLFSEWQSKSANPESVYRIDIEDDNSYLSAHSIHDDNFLIKKIKIDLVEYPYLNWSWRANILPVAGDESVKKHCDVTACVNVVLKASKWRPRSIKYSWSSTLPVGTRTKSPFAIWPSRCDIVVIESGAEKQGKWITERVNVLKDYMQFYGKGKPKSLVIEAFVIMTDSDNTETPSAADYDKIFFSKE